MSTVPVESPRPALSTDHDHRSATDAVTAFVAELQTGIDQHDADVYNRHFAADVLWGSPFGATIQGYEHLHPIHERLQRQAVGGPSSRYEIDRVVPVSDDVVVAHVARLALDDDGRPVEPSAQAEGAFSEMALYVLVRRDGTWWLAAGQNTPVLRSPIPAGPAGDADADG